MKSLRSKTVRIKQESKNDLDILQHKLRDNIPLTWVFTGDSITHGVLYTNGYRSYQELFAEHVRWEMQRVSDIVINSGISGHTTQEIISGFDWRVKRFCPDVVFLMIGTNDAAWGMDECKTFTKNLKNIANLIRKIGAIPIFQTPSPILKTADNGRRTAIHEYVKQIKSVAIEQNILLIDHYGYWKRTRSSDEALIAWLGDGLHPNEYGHRVLMQTILKALKIQKPGGATGRLFVP